MPHIFKNDHPSNPAAREARAQALAEGKTEAQATKAAIAARRRFMGLPTHEDCQKLIAAIWTQARADLAEHKAAFQAKRDEINRRAQSEVSEAWASLRRWE